MPSPFPGMNPYLESPELWPEVHSRLIVALADSLNPQLIPKYRAAIERRVYALEGKVQLPIPIEIRETYLHIKEIATGEVIAAVEVLSPTNKRPGKGRNAYEEKRRDVLSSRTHLIEIDLLRGGEAMTILAGNFKSDYRVLVSRSEQRPQADLYAFDITDEIPSFPIPLKSGDEDPVVELSSLMNQIYDRAGYEIVIDYSKSPVPPVEDDKAEWVNSLLRNKSLSTKE